MTRTPENPMSEAKTLSKREAKTLSKREAKRLQ